ncbi:hypothetical protein [Roseibium alexandrii]|uniref:Uncharacterized protein n=1 Tax=Roseibium alexandrii (strain DSM 17067 / NCIMB 14079 / DFL-11) TaxID=244592 RepID=A0A5E8GYW6_ROSAD|nr:hypothetical protein [Roseibium alexandrii]EEE45097.2 hypothetical protein SADFL11_2386 [Roseibium alexandrii DFL-11]
MRSFLTVLLLILFTAVHGVPAAAFNVSDWESQAGSFSVAAVLEDVNNVEQPAQTADLKEVMACCGQEVSDAAPHAGSKCSSDCASVLPMPPGLVVPGSVRVHENAVKTLTMAAPAVADHPPQSV